jgi:hypothetical protein
LREQRRWDDGEAPKDVTELGVASVANAADVHQVPVAPLGVAKYEQGAGVVDQQALGWHVPP